MKGSIKKIISLILTATALSAMLSVSVAANAAENEQVRVIIENNIFSEENGAAWDGTLVDEWIDIDENTTMMSAVVTALENNNYTQTGAEYGYITEINGLSAGASSYMGGWMTAINDWFTNEGADAYSVANGTLENGDEICIMYSDAWGADVGSLWDNSDTYLTGLTFSDGTLSEEFSSSVTEYTLTLPEDVSKISVTPTAYNKNYQVRTYKNEYTPAVDGSEYKRSQSIEISDGDTIYVGVGNAEWPSMNSYVSETVYKINIKVENSKLIGDVNQDGILSITDCTEIQRYLIDSSVLTENQLAVADVDSDGIISIKDVTELQRLIVNI